MELVCGVAPEFKPNSAAVGHLVGVRVIVGGAAAEGAFFFRIWRGRHHIERHVSIDGGVEQLGQQRQTGGDALCFTG